MEMEFEDWVALENMAENVKYYFSNNKDFDVNKEIANLISSITNEKLNLHLQKNEKVWNKQYKEVDFYIDEETFNEVICQPLTLRI